MANAQVHILRKACHAGSWYARDPKILEQQLDAFFQKAEPLIALPLQQKRNRILALVAPHAGYAFSGEVAAAAYQAVREQKVNRIFLLGPSHYVSLHGIALSRAEAFETPFGEVRLDQKALRALQQHPLFFENDEAHRPEHALELQLPFIKKIWPACTLVPLIVGHLSFDEVEECAIRLRSLLLPGDLIIVSSDFTHYGPRFGYTPFQKNVREELQQLNRAAYHYLAALDGKGLLAFEQETRDTICGITPLVLLLALLSKKAIASLKKYETSQEKMPFSSTESVSYLALTFSESTTD